MASSPLRVGETPRGIHHRNRPLIFHAVLPDAYFDGGKYKARCGAWVILNSREWDPDHECACKRCLRFLTMAQA